ncbi:hypothetical protein TL08_23460 [Actinoalloteichus hymeniacidonis]|uniref:DUF3558 family protein n=1 Tax=Actinoalloteichus hymeniacidonis TaxID=340345 RepID=A0AAC9HTM6_9PSEU|nr:hypothetical protein TL08_23460 [Actinoalloteichus hymeniacidonis]
MALIGGLLTAGCVAPPEPPLSSGTSPVLSEELVAYDNLEFATGRRAVFENTCEELPPELFAELGLTTEPYTLDAMSPGCAAEEEWGRVVIEQTAPRGRESQRRYFGDTWNGEGSYSDHFRRWILDDRYYALTYQGGSVGDTCTTAIHTGYLGPLTVSASIPTDERELLYVQDQDFDIETLIADYCSRSEQMAEVLVAAIDPEGGSRLAAG